MASKMHATRHAGSQADAAPEPAGEDFKKAVSVLLPLPAEPQDPPGLPGRQQQRHAAQRRACTVR